MPAGRPLKYKTPGSMQKDIDAYFALCDGDNQPTVSGLAYHLGMTTEGFRAYSGRDEFSATVKRAKQRIEVSLEQKLFAPACTGVIFNLKNNFGWKDKQDIEHSGDMKVELIKEFVPQGQDENPS